MRKELSKKSTAKKSKVKLTRRTVKDLDSKGRVKGGAINRVGGDYAPTKACASRVETC